MAEPKDETFKQKRSDSWNSKPASNKSRTTKSSSSKPKHQLSNNRSRPEDKNNELLLEALSEFPWKCYTDESGEDSPIARDPSKLNKFEDLFKVRLKNASDGMKPKTNNFFHFMTANSWPEWTDQKGLLRWMLQQPEHRKLLRYENGLGHTPMHMAFDSRLDEFINEVLNAKELDIIGILKEKCSRGNCIHLAIQYSSPKLSDLLHKCRNDTAIFTGDTEYPENTPLHVAVQETLLPTGDNMGDGVDRTNESEEDSDVDPDSNGSQEHAERAQEPKSATQELEPEPGQENMKVEREPEIVTYGLETEPARRERLQQILCNLDNDTARPRPPPRTQNANPDHLHQTYPEGSKGSEPELQSNSWVDLIELPLDYSVHLLLDICPEALSAKNKDGRTPYQERVYILLNDPVVEELVKEYSDIKNLRGGVNEACEARKTRAKREIIVKDPIAHYLRSFCMHKSKSRDEIIEKLYKPGQECHIEFDLEGIPTPIINIEYLKLLERHLKFESILKYVALPLLSYEKNPARKLKSQKPLFNEMSRELYQHGRSDFIEIFDWLWRRGVREIIKVRVVDTGEVPHADKAIVEALYGFNVEEWDWKRVDLCSDVISESSSVVREVSLYSSGNNAVMMGWASEQGLGNRKKFPLLETITLYIQEGLDDVERWNQNNTHCKESIVKHGGEGPNGEEIGVNIVPDNNPVKFASGLSTTEIVEELPLWIKSVYDFSSFLRNASKTVRDTRITPVKIAIIDDGIDATKYDLQSQIAGGATFCPYPHSVEFVNSYYVPRGKHGTIMAQLICSICPDVQLYIARLEELPSLTGSGRRVTARSAAKAVEWAVSCGVNIISMSWTIQSPTIHNIDMQNLKSALAKAQASNIILFCSASDQGENNPQDCFPGGWGQCIKIGAATFTGEKLAWVDNDANFWFPGRNVPFHYNDDKSVVYESGSSVATAAASGLAGLLIYGARLLHISTPEDELCQLQDFQNQERIISAFTAMATGDDRKFPRTENVLNKVFKSKIQGITGKSAGRLDISMLEWEKEYKAALTNLLVQLQGSKYS